MADWMRQPGFMGTHATIGADLSQFMATLFTALFIVGWVQAKRARTTGHHRLMLGGMVAMVSFFISYYLFRQLGVLAFEGKEGFGGPQALYDNVFVPLLTFHIILVIIGLVMAAYMIVLGFRAQTFAGGRRVLKNEVVQTTWSRMFLILGVLTAIVAAYFFLLVALDAFRLGKLLVWFGFLVLVGLVLAIEMALQKIWPSGARRHRVMGTFTMVIYCVLFVTGSVTYTMLYILYPGKIG